MSYNSKYTGEQVEEMLDRIASGEIGGDDTQVQVDWNVDDSTSKAYIKNKPFGYTRVNVAEGGSYSASSPIIWIEHRGTTYDIKNMSIGESIKINAGPPINVVKTSDNTITIQTSGNYLTSFPVTVVTAIPLAKEFIPDDFLDSDEVVHLITQTSADWASENQFKIKNRTHYAHFITITAINSYDLDELGVPDTVVVLYNDSYYTLHEGDNQISYGPPMLINLTDRTLTIDSSSYIDKTTPLKIATRFIKLPDVFLNHSYYHTDFTILDLQQLVNGDVTEIPVNCDALAAALRNNQIILIPYGPSDDGYFGYSVPDVYTEDLVYMAVNDCGTSLRYIIEMNATGSVLSSDQVWLDQNNSMSNTNVINLGIDFEELDRVSTAGINGGQLPSFNYMVPNVSYQQFKSMILSEQYTFITTFASNDHVINCPIYVTYDVHSDRIYLEIYAQYNNEIPDSYLNFHYSIVISSNGSLYFTRHYDSKYGGYVELNHGTSNTEWLEISANEFHIWDEVAELSIVFTDEIDGVANEYLFQFTSGSEPTVLSLPDDIKWVNGEAPVIEANKIYQISILKGLGSVMSWDNKTSLFPITLVEEDNGATGVAVYNYLWDNFGSGNYLLNSGDLTLIIDSTSYDVTEGSYEGYGYSLVSFENGPAVTEYYLTSEGFVNSRSM